MNSAWKSIRSAPKNRPVLLRYFGGNAPAWRDSSRIIVTGATFSGRLWHDQLGGLISDVSAKSSKNKPLCWMEIPRYVPDIKIYTFLCDVDTKNSGSISVGAEDFDEAFKSAKRIAKRLKIQVSKTLVGPPKRASSLEECNKCGGEGTIASTSTDNSSGVCLNCGNHSS